MPLNIGIDWYFGNGEWRENRAHGKGRFVHVDGDIYDGFWAND